jgi:hypothetical protein
MMTGKDTYISSLLILSLLMIYLIILEEVILEVIMGSEVHSHFLNEYLELLLKHLILTSSRHSSMITHAGESLSLNGIVS